MILISILSLFAIVSSQTQRRSVCLKLESVYESICPSQVERTALRSLQGPPGKVGPNGREGMRGRQGIKGEKGSAGEANYGRVEEMISGRIQEALNEQSRKYSEISNLLEEANERIGNIENKTDHCPVKYNGKCFWIEYQPSITNEQGRAMCYTERGRLADIYSEEHYHMLWTYLRMFGRGSNGWAGAWLGMTYNSKTNTVSLSDGTTAPFLKWYPGQPLKGSSYTSHIYLHLIVLRDGANPNQHLAQANSAGTTYGAICEK